MRECWVIEEQNIETGDWFTVQVCADESHARAVLRVWRSDYPHRVVRYIPADTLAQVTYCGKPLKLGADEGVRAENERLKKVLRAASDDVRQVSTRLANVALGPDDIKALFGVLTPVSPVEPTPEPSTEDWYTAGRIDKCPDPRCGCSMEHSPDCAMPAPTGEPATCVWRLSPNGRYADAECRQSTFFEVVAVREWTACPYCLKPLTVER